MAVALALAVLVLTAALVIARQPSSQAGGCAKSPAVSGQGCGVLWGSALAADNSALPAAVAAQERAEGRPLDIVHTYHRWYDVFPTVSEQELAAAGHELFLNWEPQGVSGQLMSWASIAEGAHDQQIDALAARLRRLPNDVLLSFSHEPEQKWTQHGSATDFVAAFRHIHDRMQEDGATNVRWVWDLMGLTTPVWLARYKQLWPGDEYVDWVGWDPYNADSCEPGHTWQSFSQTVDPFYKWLEAHGFGDKPFMLGEYGTVEKPGDPSGKADWYAGIPKALATMPNLKALVYFDVGAPPANCNWQISTSGAATRAFDRLAASPAFR
ncbi:MAG TPA: glycosyl hydrolase [Jatrophihabitantaceae bacterium]|nr:glycosyl hydrolase [Jatrophihabitantaceae bacterium]